MHGFAVYELAFLAVIKTDVIIRKVHCSDNISLYHGNGIFKTFTGNMILSTIIGTVKNNFLKQFLQSFRAKKIH